MKTLTTSPIAALCAAAMFVLSGCGGEASGQRETARVQGTVTYQGQPLTTGTVFFVPEGGGPTAEGQIGEDGTFELTTYEEGDGAVPGKHGVMIHAQREVQEVLPEDEDPDNPQDPQLIPPKYSSVETSGLTATVTADGENSVKFELQD